jgi:3-phenylpropionate/trans-cinnamate dioxygenase ferredoxin reductase subunit
MNQTCIIVGAGHAAVSLATTLRQEHWEGRIVVIGEEGYLPYHRPPLSKAYLAGAKTLEEIYLRPAAVFEKAGIEFLVNSRVEAIDRDHKRVTLNNGQSLAYDKLALTTGSRVRRIALPGVELDGVCYLRQLKDADSIRSRIEAGHRAVIVGGGYIGLETAAVLVQLGMKVMVIEMMDRILQRVTAPEVSAFYNRVHTEEGVDIVCNTGVQALQGNDCVSEVVCNNGEIYGADLVIIGVGIVPNLELAASAGLEVKDGIVVDEYTRSSDPDIVAAGDCTWHYNRLYDRWLRLESVQNATDQSRAAAATLCGQEQPYATLPWFWSDQFDLKLQIAGLSQGYTGIVIRGDKDRSRSFAAFYFKDDRVIAVDAVNMPPEFMIGKKMITEGIVVDKQQLMDASVHIREMVK